MTKRDLQRVIEDNRGKGIRPSHEWCSWKPPADSEDLEAREPIFLDFSENRNAPHTTAWRLCSVRWNSSSGSDSRLAEGKRREREALASFAELQSSRGAAAAAAEDGVMYVITELAQSEALWERCLSCLA